MGLTTLPPLQTGRETFASSGFPVLTRGNVLRWFVVRRAWLRLLRQAWHLTFPMYSPPYPYRLAFPGGPSPCLGHYSLAFGYYAASALYSARWHSRGLRRSSGFRVPQFHLKRLKCPLAACCTPGGVQKQPSTRRKLLRHPPYLLVWV